MKNSAAVCITVLKEKEKKKTLTMSFRDIKYEVLVQLLLFFHNLYLLCFYSNIKVAADDLHVFYLRRRSLYFHFNLKPSLYLGNRE